MTAPDLSINRLRQCDLAMDQAGHTALQCMSYGTDQRRIFRRAAVYVDKILKGEKAADLPVEQPTKFEFLINNKTAKAIGYTISESLLLRADEVIE